MIDKKQVKQHDIKIVESGEAMDREKQQKIQQLKQLMPNLVNADNQIDAQALQDFIDIAHTTSNNKGYELTFAGKGLAREAANDPTPMELKKEAKQSKDFDNTQNVVIRGDNLDVLKILYQNYYRKIKMIYIDPPYNTQNDNFVYKDNFKRSDEELIKRYRLDSNTIDFLHDVYGARSHSGWLAFMYPRLKLARDLLTDDGVIFISIDDNEQANLKILCDEIFGEDNFVGNLTRVTKKGGNKGDYVKPKKDSILSYFKSISKIEKENFGSKYNSQPIKWLTEKFNGKNRIYIKGDIPYREKLESRTNQRYYIEAPDGTLLIPKGNVFPEIQEDEQMVIPESDADKCWTWSLDRYKKEKTNNRFIFLKSNKSPFLDENGNKAKWTVYKKIFQEEYENKKEILTDLLEKFENSQGTKELGNLGIPFTNPKPVNLIKYLTRIVTGELDIVLDFFAGSGTTGDAVMQLNAEDGGNRKFILAQWDEPIDRKKNSEAHNFCTQNGFTPVISSITIERLNRAGEKIKQETEDKNGKLFDKPLPDIGYKVFSLTPKPQRSNPADGELITINNPRTQVYNTLINMLCATCKPIDTKIIQIKKGAIYKADNEIYILGNITRRQLERYRDLKINIDGYTDIPLIDWLNLGILNKDNITIVY